MIKYKIKKEENGVAIIEKSGKKFTFSSADVKSDLVKINAQKKQYSSQAELNQAEMTNIEEHHPFVKEMSDEDIHAAHMYWESKKIRDACLKLLPDIDAAIEETEEAVREVEKQCGINMLTYGQDGSGK